MKHRHPDDILREASKVRVGIARTRGRTFCFLLSNVASEVFLPRAEQWSIEAGQHGSRPAEAKDKINPGAGSV